MLVEIDHGPNPVLVAVEAGHVLGEKGSCKECGSHYPCVVISEARSAAAKRGARMDIERQATRYARLNDKHTPTFV